MPHDIPKTEEECIELIQAFSEMTDEDILSYPQETKFTASIHAMECNDLKNVFRLIELGLEINYNSLFVWISKLSDEQISYYDHETLKTIGNLAINREDYTLLERLKELGYDALTCQNLKLFSDAQIAESSDKTKFDAFKIAYQCKDSSFAAKLIDQGFVVDKNITDRLITDLNLQSDHIEEICLKAKQTCNSFIAWECSREMLGMCNYLVFEEL